MRLIYPALFACIHIAIVLNNAFSDDFGGLPVYVDFDSYSCFTDSELSTLDNTLLSGISLSEIKQQELNRLGLAIADWSLPGNAAAIIMKEMFNISNITLINFYLNAFEVLTTSKYTDIMIASQFELYPADFDETIWNEKVITGDLTDLLSGIKIWSGIYGKTEWLENMENYFESSCEYGEFWKSYENPDIISIMTPSSQIPNIIHADDGNYECSPERFDFFDDYPCINGTFIPSQCVNGNCSSIVGYNPYYDLGLVQSFLTDYNNVNLDIKYIGEYEIASVLLTEYMSSYDSLFTFWEPSIMVSSGQFKLIRMPSDYIEQQSSQLRKLMPKYLNKISSFIYEFLELVEMTNDDYQWILNYSYSTIYSGFNQTSQTRLESTCKWLKYLLLDTNNINNDNGLSDPRDWIPTATVTNDISCSDYTNQQLEKLIILDNYNEMELLTTLKYKNDENIIIMLDESGVNDILQALRIKEKCPYNDSIIIAGNMSTTTQSENKDNTDTDSDNQNGWMIVAIIFIILFVIAIIYIGYRCFMDRKDDNNDSINTVDVDQQELGKMEVTQKNETTPMKKEENANHDIL